MKQRAEVPIALVLLMGMALAGKILPGAGSIPASAQEPAAGAPIPARSPLFEALERRATGDAARRKANARSVETWDRKRAFAAMERLRAEIVMLGGLRGAQQELLLWNRERIKSGGSPAVLPATFGAAVRRPGRSAARPRAKSTAKSTVRSTARSTPKPTPKSTPNAVLNDALDDSGPAEERMPPNQPDSGPTEDELR